WRRFGQVFRAYEEAAVEAEPPRPPSGHLAPGARGRLTRARVELASSTTPQLAARLVDTVEHGDELELAQLRPYALADRWGAPRRAVLEACLYGVRTGLLELRWSVLCPLCRGPVDQRPALRDLDVGDVHCES